MNSGYGEIPGIWEAHNDSVRRNNEAREQWRNDVKRRLLERFDIPEQFIEMAIDIWFNGKED